MLKAIGKALLGYIKHKVLGPALAVLVVVLALVVGVIVFMPPQRMIFMFDSSVPGTAAADDALAFAAQHHVDAVINYSSINAMPADITKYLDHAEIVGTKVVVSLKDLFAATDSDKDPANRAFHQAQGATTEEQAVKYAQVLGAHPAVYGFLQADEPEGSVDDVAGALKTRRDLLHRVSSKPVLTAVYRHDLDYLKKVKEGTDLLLMDYYPYPETPDYGPIDDITAIARDMHEAAGNDSVFCLQAFSYQLNEPETHAHFHFPTLDKEHGSGAPSAPEMLSQSQKALQGGVRHLCYFSYSYARDIGKEHLDNLGFVLDRVPKLHEF